MNILFVCTGNTCRSPMAEGYLKSLALSGVKTKSVGMSFSGDPASQNSVQVMSEIGIDISLHRSAVITASHIDWADRIYCMTDSHKAALLGAGINKGKLFVLGEGIPDPFGRDINAYRQCRDEIIRAVDSIDFSAQSAVCIMSDESEADGIEAIEKQCFSKPWSKKSITESFLHGTRFFIYKEQGKTVGYMGISCILDEGYITNIAVLPKRRRKGIASALLEFCLEYAKEKELSFVSLEVRKSNLAAIKLYEKFGFIIEGERKNFYECPTENALLMTRRF
jgi:ribosomal-protein-alanine N-acetyltransferase